MSSQHLPDTPPRGADKVIAGIVSIFDFAAGSFFAAALLINFANVVGRYVFHSPIFWAEEVTIILIIWSVCLMSFKLTLNNEHLVTDILRPYLPPRWQKVLVMLNLLFGMVLSAFIAYYAFIVVQMVARMSQVTTVAEMPKSWAYSSILACFFLVVVAGAIRVYRLSKGEIKDAVPPGTDLSGIDEVVVARSL